MTSHDPASRESSPELDFPEISQLLEESSKSPEHLTAAGENLANGDSKEPLKTLSVETTSSGTSNTMSGSQRAISMSPLTSPVEDVCEKDAAQESDSESDEDSVVSYADHPTQNPPPKRKRSPSAASQAAAIEVTKQEPGTEPTAVPPSPAEDPTPDPQLPSKDGTQMNTKCISASARSPSSPPPPKKKRVHIAPSLNLAYGNRRHVGQLPATQPLPAAHRRPQTRVPPSSQPLPKPRPSSSGTKSFSASTSPPRRASRGTASHAKRERSAEFWHLDGSVVIEVARSRGPNVMFKLFRSQLAQWSRYFSRRFAEDDAMEERTRGAGVDDDGDDEVLVAERDRVDRCPVYLVRDVSVDDFVEMLRALTMGIAYIFEPHPFAHTAAILRAAHALEVDQLTKYAVQVLHKMWPSDLAQLTAEVKPHAAETIVLGQACAVPEILRRAYYELLRTPSFGQDPERVYDEHSAEGRLPYTDLVRLISAREKLRAEWHAIALHAPMPTVFPCPLTLFARESQSPGVQAERAACLEARRRESELWGEHVTQPLFKKGDLDPICALKDIIAIEWKEFGLCIGCVAARRETWQQKQEQLWEGIDECFQYVMPSDEGSGDDSS